MNEKDVLIDQTAVAEDVSEKIHYSFKSQFLIKPLDPIKVKKEFNKPVLDDKPTTDKNGVEAVDYKDVETEVKEVEADFRKGVVLKVPFSYKTNMNSKDYPEMPIHVGDVVVYRQQSAKWFDILKDTQLLSSYDIVAVENNGNNSKTTVGDSKQ